MRKKAQKDRTSQHNAPRPRRQQQAFDRQLDEWRLEYANRVLCDSNEAPWRLGSDVRRFGALRRQFAVLAVEVRRHLDALERAVADPLAAGADEALQLAYHGGPLSDERRDEVVDILLGLQDTAAAIRAARRKGPEV